MLPRAAHTYGLRYHAATWRSGGLRPRLSSHFRHLSSVPAVAPRRLVRKLSARFLFGISASLAAGAAGLYATDRELFFAFTRICRCATTAAAMSIDYSWSLRGLEGDAHAVALHEAHVRNGAVLKEALFLNKGIYIKLGQYLGTLDYLVPEEYVVAMRECFDDAPRTPLEDVRAVFQEDFGCPPEDLFHAFDPVPFACASLAQVHRAESSTGQQFAVKVQHRALGRLAMSEISSIDYILRAVRFHFPQFGFQWLVDELRTNLPLELDFRQEAANGAKCSELVASFGQQIVVPRVHAQLSSGRVLTMDFEHGKPLGDRVDMEQRGLQPKQVCRLLSEVFCKMVFVHGFVHCDPHPGNVLVRNGPDGKSLQLVLLDHGLYKTVPNELRLEYCRLWKSVVMSDSEGIQRASKNLGVESPWMKAKYPDDEDLSHTLLAAMLTAREWGDIIAEGGIARLDQESSSSEVKQQLSSNVQEYLHGIVDVLERLPRPLLLLLKTNDALRSAAFRLGAQSADTFAVTARTCASALWANGITGPWTHRMKGYWELLVVYWSCNLYMWWQS